MRRAVRPPAWKPAWGSFICLLPFLPCRMFARPPATLRNLPIFVKPFRQMRTRHSLIRRSKALVVLFLICINDFLIRICRKAAADQSQRQTNWKSGKRPFGTNETISFRSLCPETRNATQTSASVATRLAVYQLIRVRISLVCSDRRGRTVARIQKRFAYINIAPPKQMSLCDSRDMEFSTSCRTRYPLSRTRAHAVSIQQTFTRDTSYT